MVEETTDIVEQTVLFEVSAGISEYLSARVLKEKRECDPFDVAPSDLVVLTRRAVVYHDTVGPLSGGIPGHRYHQIDHCVHWDEVGTGPRVKEHSSQDAFATGQNQTRRSVDIIDPPTQGFPPGGGHDRWSDDGHRQRAALVDQQRFGQRLGVGVSVWSVAQQFGRQSIDHRLVHPFDGVDDLLRRNGRRV